MEARNPPAERARRRAPVVAAAVLVVLVFVITSWPTASVAPTPSTPSAAPEPIVRVAPAFLPSGDVHALGATPAEAPILVVVGLAPPAPAAMSAMLALLSTPGTPEYGHYLTAAQVAEL
ncbi:MAG: hypothetical protein L3J91_07140, partial [Thermoplasmata archaeon]|nr:hypothetical protein [Thermoplasmata archaeon]